MNVAVSLGAGFGSLVFSARKVTTSACGLPSRLLRLACDVSIIFRRLANALMSPLRIYARSVLFVPSAVPILYLWAWGLYFWIRPEKVPSCGEAW